MKDNYDLWVEHDAEQERQLDKLPLCAWCKERIQGEYLYNINGELVCEYCIEECREDADRYIRE